MRLVILLMLLGTTLTGGYAATSTLLQEVDTTYLVKVIRIQKQEIQQVPNTETSALYQTLEVEVIKGDFLQKKFEVTESGFNAKVGDVFYFRYLKTGNGQEYYSLQEPYRIPGLIGLGIGFIILVLLLGGKHGFLALIGLFVSFGAIFKIMFPQLLSGGNVVIIATVGALLSLFVVMYISHGFTRLTTSAFLGSAGAVLLTVFIAKYVVVLTSLTGYASEESVYLNLSTGGSLDFVALLIGGIIIGVIGVVDDVAVTQASVVNELHQANSTFSRTQLYRKALKVGKDHTGAVVNTLILAYTGASLPLVLLLYTSQTSVVELINREIIATEIVRSIVGSMGLLCAMPLTTLIAVWLIYKHPVVGAHSHHTHK